jgi:hypothetical protein
MREAIAQLPDSERLLFGLHFEARMTVADIARALHDDQKRLYRRIKTLKAGFRRHLEAAGIQAEHASAIIGDPVSDLDFGFEDENLDLRPSLKSGSDRESGED